MFWDQPIAPESLEDPEVRWAVREIDRCKWSPKALLCTPQAKNIRTLNVPHPQIVLNHEDSRAWIFAVTTGQIAGWLMSHGVGHFRPYFPFICHGEV